jgi:hypothetical protein
MEMCILPHWLRGRKIISVSWCLRKQQGESKVIIVIHALTSTRLNFVGRK